MKEVGKFFIFALTFLFASTILVSAVEVEVDSEYSKGETMIAKFSGNFLDPILKENIVFYRDHVRVPMDFDVTKIDDEYYVYAILPENEANYSISVEDVRYYQGSQIKDDDIVRNFSIMNETAPFYITPGFIVTSESFFIQAQNLLDKKIKILISTGEIETAQDSGGFFSFFSKKEEIVPEYDSIELKSGEIKKINFDISNIKEDSLTKIVLSSEGQTYRVPLFAFVTEENSVNEDDRKFRLNPALLEIKTAQKEFVREFWVESTGEGVVRNITISTSKSLEPYVEFSRTFIEDLDPNQTLRIEALFKVSDDTKVLEGGILADSPDFNSDTDVIIFISDDYSPIDETNNNSFKTCSELGGEACNENQNCTGETTFASDSVCCLGFCEDVDKKSSSTGKIFGWLLIIIAIAVIFWFWKTKYKKFS